MPSNNMAMEENTLELPQFSIPEVLKMGQRLNIALSKSRKNITNKTISTKEKKD